MLFSEKTPDPRQYSPLALAYIGDTVFDLYVRTKIMERGNLRVTDMHRRAVSLVRAESQAKMARMLQEEVLDPEEVGILKWGRNAKVNTHPKGASLADYHMATGLETLVGFLYLDGRRQRLGEILDRAYANFNEE